MRRKQRASWFGPLTKPLARLLPVVAAPWFVAIGLLGLLIGGAYFTWQKVSPEILRDPQYALSAAKIEVTPQPAWIAVDVKAEVVRDGSLHQLKLHDQQLLAKIADAFAVHTWVAKVRRVRKYHGKVVVELQYRRPVAMVEVTTEQGAGLVFVDPSGVILPSSSFSEAQTRDFLRLWVPGVKSFGVVGTPWGDERVHQAAGIAAAWGSRWKKLGLYRIVAAATSLSEREQNAAQYELQTRAGARIIWGSAVGRERPGEAAAEVKIAHLLRYAHQHGPLDKAAHRLALDVRDGTVKQLTPRTATLQRPN